MKKINFRKIITLSGAHVLMGKDEKGNDELMKKFKGKENTILHTQSPGSPFGVIEELNPSKQDITASGSAVAKYSQDWRDNKKNIVVNVFTGKDISKKFWMKPGSWKVKKAKKITIKKQDIIKFEKKNGQSK